MKKLEVDRQYQAARAELMGRPTFHVLSPKDYGEEYLPRPSRFRKLAIGIAIYIALIIAGAAFLLDKFKIIPN